MHNVVDIERSKLIIKKLIKEKFGTQAAFCKATGEDPAYLSRLLNGKDPKRKLSPGKIIDLEEKLGVQVGSILFPDIFKNNAATN